MYVVTVYVERWVIKRDGVCADGVCGKVGDKG